MDEDLIPASKRQVALAGLRARLDRNHQRALQALDLMQTLDHYDRANDLIAKQRSPWDRLCSEFKHDTANEEGTDEF